MKYSKQNWIILFGGSGREGIIDRMINERIPIQAIIVPVKQSKILKKSILKLESMGLKISEASPKNLDSILLNYDVSNILSIGFPYIISKNILIRHKIAINIHPTLLPKYRGPTTGAYILINNEKESGSTVHHMIEKADAGDIILQKKVKLSPFDTIKSLQRKVYSIEPDLISESFRLLDQNIARKQNLAKGSIFLKRRQPSDSQIDPTKPLIELINEIRASDPEHYPAFFYYNGEKVNLKLWRDKKPNDAEDEI
ncbi:MAG: methionyl-tRNA formyltransferase [Candidatus Neomarinimicrobiota bacterium]